jgi:ABC-2 type transport system permease protein
MSEFWKIFAHEYSRFVFRKRYLWILLSLPLMLVLFSVISLIAIAIQLQPHPVGIVDFTNRLQNYQKSSKETSFSQLSLEQVFYFQDQSSGLQALQSAKIKYLFIIPEDFLNSGQIKVVSDDPPSPSLTRDIKEQLVLSYLAEKPADLRTRLLNSPDIVIRSFYNGKILGNDQIFNMAFPLISGFVFIFAVNFVSSYVIRAISDEKENRTIEILITSTRPFNLMAAKIIASITVGLTPLLFWSILPLTGIIILWSQVSFLKIQQFDAGVISVAIISSVLAFTMLCAFMAGLGAAYPAKDEATQIAGLFTLPFGLPYILITRILLEPNQLLAVILSQFPITAPIVLPLRMAFGQVPYWQIGSSLLLLLGCVFLSLWFASRAINLGMLQLDRRLTLKEIFKTHG